MIILIIEHIEFLSVSMTIELTGDRAFEPIQVSEFLNTDSSQVSHRLTILLKF